MSTDKTQLQKKPSHNQNPLINIVVNIAFPALILHKFSSPDRLGPLVAMAVALSLPILYGAYEFFTTRQQNIISIIGFVSILLTGGLGLLQVSGFWYAAKDAAVPGLIAVATLVSLKTSKPLVKLILYNDRVINVLAVEQALDTRGTRSGFGKLMVQTTLILACSFTLSAILNFFLALHILTAPAGTPEFASQLGRMTAMSFPVIVVPSMIVMMIAVWLLVRGLKGLTGLEMDQILSDQKKA